MFVQDRDRGESFMRWLAWRAVNGEARNDDQDFEYTWYVSRKIILAYAT